MAERRGPDGGGDFTTVAKALAICLVVFTHADWAEADRLCPVFPFVVNSPCAWLGGGLRRPTALRFCARREERAGGWRVPGETLRSSCACREKRATVRPLRVLLILRNGAGGAGLLGRASRTFFSSCAGKPPCLSSSTAERPPRRAASSPAPSALPLPCPAPPPSGAPIRVERRPPRRTAPHPRGVPHVEQRSRPPAWVLHTLPVQWTC